MTVRDDRREKAVRGLQRMLGELSAQFPFLPGLEEDGVFGERTLEAVMLFQRELHPPVTGVVDQGTWEAIRARWEGLGRTTPTARPARLFPGRAFQVEPGGEHELMLVPQAMFRALSRQFSGLSAAAPSGLHGAASAADVKWLQRAAGLRETGAMDQAAWNMLSRLYEIFVVGAAARSRPGGAEGGWG